MSALEAMELAEKLKDEGEKMYNFFSGLTEEQWKVNIYTEGATWSVRNVLAHFVSSERGLIKLFEQIRQGSGGATEDFSIDRYNAAQQEKNREVAPSELIGQYKEARGRSVEWVAGLTDKDLEITGRHPFLGQTVIREMVKMLYLHNQLHYRDIRRSLR